MGRIMPSFSSLLPAAASHRSESFASAAGLVGSGFTTSVRICNALDGVATDTTSHGASVAHRRDIRLSGIGTIGLGDIVGPFIGVNTLGVFERLALSSQSVGGRQRMTEGGFVSGCSVLIDPNDPPPIDHAGRSRGQFSGGGQLSFKLLEGLSGVCSGVGWSKRW